MNRLLLVALLSVLGCFAVSADKKKCDKGYCVRVRGRSGRIDIYKDGEEKTKGITILFDAIREKGKDGKNDVGKSEKHATENFASVGFEFSESYEKKIENISAICFNFSSTLPGPNATLIIPICIFKENGTITLCDGEEVSIRAGMVKFNIELENWKFCGDLGVNCTKGESGEFVDLVIAVSTPKGKKPKKTTHKKEKAQKKRRAPKFDFGDKTAMDCPQSVEKDNTCAVMPEDYPKLEEKGGKYMLTFRFPKFSHRVVYDPAVNLEADEPVSDGDDNSSTAIASSMVAIAIACFLCLFW